MPITLERVSYTYERFAGDGRPAVQSMDLALQAGELIGLMGLSGSGRSTLLQLIAGMLYPTEGSILLDGERINSRRGKRLLREQLAFLPAGAEKMLFESTVERELACSLRGRGLSQEETQARIRSVLQELGLPAQQILQCSPLSLSGNDKRTLALGCVLVTQPRYLILDEPFAFLSRRERQLRMQILEKRCQSGCCVLLSCNDSELLSQCATRILLIEQGKLVWDGRAKSILTDYYELLRRGMPIPPIEEACRLLWEKGVDLPGNLVAYQQFIDRLKIIAWRKQNEQGKGEQQRFHDTESGSRR